MARHWRSAGLLSTAVSAIVVLGAGQALAQATGQVQVSSGASGSARLDRLQQLLLLPPEARLNLFVVPEFQHEEFEGYTETRSWTGWGRSRAGLSYQISTSPQAASCSAPTMCSRTAS